MQIRLQKVLAQAGISSRRAAEELITAGRVKVNGEVVTVLGSRVDPEKDLIQVDGKLVSREESIYLLLYKPEGVVTTLSDPQGRKTIVDCLTGVKERVFAVGRLDQDAEGALIVTNDGDLANKLMHPRYEVPRTYLAKVKGVPDEATLERLKKGVTLEDGEATPQFAAIEEQTERNAWLRLVLSEGRPHLVKRLCAAIGHPVLRLYRPFYGALSVAGMAPGEFRALTPHELESLSKEGGGTTAEKMATAELRLPRRRHRSLEGEGDAGGAEGEELPLTQPEERKAPRRRLVEGDAGAGAERRSYGERPARAPRAFGDRPPRSFGDRPTRPPRAFGDRPARSFGDRPARPPREFGDRPPRSFGDRPARPPREFGDRPPRSFGDRPARPPRAFGDKPARSFGDRPARPPREFGDRPPRSFGDRPARPPRAFGDKPARSFGDRPARPPREFGDRPPRSFGDRPARPPREFGDRPPRSFGDRPARPPKEFGDRPPRSFGDRPARPPREFGDRPPRSFGDRPARPPREFGDKPARSFGDRPARPPRTGYKRSSS